LFSFCKLYIFSSMMNICFSRFSAICPPAVLLTGYHNVISLVEPQRASMLVYVAICFWV